MNIHRIKNVVVKSYRAERIKVCKMKVGQESADAGLKSQKTKAGCHQLAALQ